ncbi:MAG TPA: biotin/lipoyl-containing protein [Bacteroidia bacterium]|nr:biotin/lipoyl-containing protein [Bacteroidia bacterium]
MYKAKVNDREFEIKQGKSPGIFLVNGEEIKIDLLKLKEGSFHVIQNHRSYSIEVLRINADEKKVELRVNNNNYSVHLKDQYDELLHRLGMDEMISNKVNDLKAPMPGLVVAVNVADGQTVKKGDVLITLEAMKMENTLKAVADAIVRKVVVKKGAAVEKNEVLIYLQ